MFDPTPELTQRRARLETFSGVPTAPPVQSLGDRAARPLRSFSLSQQRLLLALLDAAKQASPPTRAAMPVTTGSASEPAEADHVGR